MIFAGNTLHGGYIGYIADLTTTLPLLSLGSNNPGVSVELNISYMKAAKEGELVTVETEVLKLGKSLAFTEAVLTNEKGDLIAKAKHTKFVGGEFNNVS